MSEKRESEGITIGAGSALTFAAPEGGTKWRLRNTETGLVFETDAQSDTRPVARLTPDGLVVRGDLIVDGEIRRELDCHKFIGSWAVVEGHSRRRGGRGNDPDESVAVIDLRDDGRFELGFVDPKTDAVIFVQTLRFNPRTGTLDDDDPRRGPERCISFWDCRGRGAERDRIFAMRKAKVGIPPAEAAALEKTFLPWELTTDDKGKIVVDDDNGTWGAEGG